MRKLQSAILITITLLLKLSIFAQAPSTCNLTGTVYNPDGTLAIGVQFRVSKISKNGALISQGPFVYTTDSNGIIRDTNNNAGITLPQGSAAYVYSTVPPWNVTGGVPINVPNTSSAALASLATVAAVPVTGATVQTGSGPTTLTNKEGTFWFTSGLKATEMTPGVAKIEIDTASTAIVPGTRTISATSPVRVDGGASADLSANRTISLTNPVPVGTGTPYNEPGLGGFGATAQALLATSGSSGSPNSSTTPVTSFEKQDSSNPNDNTSIIPFFISTRKQSGCCFYYQVGNFLRQESATLRDAVAFQSNIFADPVSTPGVIQTHWAGAFRAERNKVGTRISATEFDSVNSATVGITGTGVTVTNGSANVVGTGTTFTTDFSQGEVIVVGTSPIQYGVVGTVSDNTHLAVVSVYNAGTGGTSATFSVAGSTVTATKGANASTSDSNANFTAGINVVPTGPGRNGVGIRFQTGTPAGPYDTGISWQANSVFSYAIDTNEIGQGLGATPVRPLRIGNNSYVVGRNAANSADVRFFGIDGSDALQFAPDGSGSNFSGQVKITRTASSFGASVSSLLFENPSGGGTNIWFTFAGADRGSMRVDSSGNYVLNAFSSNFYFDSDLGSAPTFNSTNGAIKFADGIKAGSSGQFAVGNTGIVTGGTWNGTAIDIAHGGSGQATKAAAFDALSPMTTAGDLIYGGASGTGTRLVAGTSSQLLHSGATPSWAAVNLASEVTGTLPVANGGSGVTTTNAVHVYNSADISIPNNTETAVTFDSEFYDSNSMHSTSSNTDRLIAPVAGVYQVCAAISFASNATGLRYGFFQFNGATYTSIQKMNSTGGGGIDDYMSWCGQYSFAANDFVKLVVYQNSGGSLNLKSAASYSPRFSMARISASN